MKRLKKGGFVNWVELSFFAMLGLGFLLGKLAVDASFSYFLLAMAGLVAGRLAHTHRENDPVPFIAIILAFVIGFLLAHRAGAGIFLLISFTSAAIVSNRLHKLLNSS